MIYITNQKYYTVTLAMNTFNQQYSRSAGYYDRILAGSVLACCRWCYLVPVCPALLHRRHPDAGIETLTMDPLWTITESRFDPAQARAYEGFFTLGSGLLHIRGSLEEGLFSAPQNLDYTRRPANVTSEKFAESSARWGPFNPGIRGNHPLLNRGIVNLPFFLDLTPYVGDEKLDVEASDIRFFERTLSLKEAILSRNLTWNTRLGAQLQVAFRAFCQCSASRYLFTTS